MSQKIGPDHAARSEDQRLKDVHVVVLTAKGQPITSDWRSRIPADHFDEIGQKVVTMVHMSLEALVHQDARMALARRPLASLDVIIGDVFHDVAVPYQEHVLPMIPGGGTVKEIIKE